MSVNSVRGNLGFDKEIVDIVDYVENYEIKSDLAYETAWSCLLDTI
ncbi:MAG: hypothetical protein AABY37_03620, partial [Actinomycetota bacterium]